SPTRAGTSRRPGRSSSITTRRSWPTPTSPPSGDTSTRSSRRRTPGATSSAPFGRWRASGRRCRQRSTGTSRCEHRQREQPADPAAAAGHHRRRDGGGGRGHRRRARGGVRLRRLLGHRRRPVALGGTSGPAAQQPARPRSGRLASLRAILSAMPEPIVIVGVGGHGREVEHLIRAINDVRATWTVAGFADDAPSEENLRLVDLLEARYLGTVEDLLDGPAGTYVVGIGTGEVRRRVDERMTQAGWQAAVLVHPAASIGHDVVLGPGSVVCAGVTATTNIRCGRHVHLNRTVAIGHDSVLDDYVTVHPLSSVSGTVHLEESVTIGTTAAVLQNLTVGAGAVV